MLLILICNFCTCFLKVRFLSEFAVFQLYSVGKLRMKSFFFISLPVKVLLFLVVLYKNSIGIPLD